MKSISDLISFRTHRVFTWLVLLFSPIALSACGTSPSPISIEWTTATEINSAGFNLYRSENADGPYVKLNDALIPASYDPILGGKYYYKDTMVNPGQTYYYQLEDLDLSGTGVKHGPIVATAPIPWQNDLRVWGIGIVVIGMICLTAWRLMKK